MPKNAVTGPNVALCNLRTAAGLSQQDVAEEMSRISVAGGQGILGVSANTVSRWERGVITPMPLYRRLLAELFQVSVEDCGFVLRKESTVVADDHGETDTFMDDENASPVDERVSRSQDGWRRTRRALNTRRAALTQLATTVYDPDVRLGGTGLIARRQWIPAEPVDLAAVGLVYRGDAAQPLIDGTEPESANVRPRVSLVRRYQRYTQAIRDLEHPRIFENRASWRMLDLAWPDEKGSMTFGPTSYFAGVDIYEAAAHEMAYVHLDDHGNIRGDEPVMRDLPFRKFIGDPFDFARRPVLPSISTLTVRRAPHESSFILHRRDPRSVAVAGRMLQVIPSGVFQPSSVMPTLVAADFDLWRNIMREYSEELFGNAEHDGDGRPVSYDTEPFRTLNRLRDDRRLRVYCLGVALDALTLVGEILTVAVFDADAFDAIADEFVDTNDEGTVVKTRVAFTEDGIGRVFASGRLAPAGAGCIQLAWQHRERLGLT